MITDDFFNLIRSRHTVRRYKPDAVPLDKLKAMLDVACYAPYGGGKEPWKFILVIDKDKIEKIAALPRLDYDYGRYIGSAPALVAALWKPLRYPSRNHDVDITDHLLWQEYKQDITVGLLIVGHAIQNLLLAATVYGLGAGYVGPFHRDAGIEELLGIEKPYTVCALISLGYPLEEAERQPKDTSSLIEIQ